MDTPTQELPAYKSHKTVWALKIAGIVPKDPAYEGAIITPADSGFAPFDVSADYVNKHSPKVGGYWVKYADDYESYSPAKAFEEGYTRVGYAPEAPPPDQPYPAPVPLNFQQRVVAEKADLDDRLAKLNAFWVTPTYQSLPIDDQLLLRSQAELMTNLSNVLAKRISRFA